MKKNITLLVLLCTLSFYAHSETIYINELEPLEYTDLYYEYNTEDMTASITGYNTENAPSDNITLPSTTIRADDSLEFNIIAIGEFAFKGCTSLGSIDLKGCTKLTKIDRGAFYNSSITSIELPMGFEELAFGAFNSCSSLTSIDIPESLTTIDSYAFFNCTSLGNIDISNCNNLEKINANAFSGCSLLTEINLSESTTYIGDYAFSGCSLLTEINLSEGTTYIGTYAFNYCTSLSNIDLSNCNSLKEIGTYAFTYCTSLSSIDLPIGITEIDEGVFTGCSSITSINFLNKLSIQKIGKNAFRECSSLTSIYLPESVSEIGYAAFAVCGELTSVDFRDCNNLTLIDSYAFTECSNLNYIYVNWETPTVNFTSTNAFNTYSTTTLYVPAGCKETYQDATVWKKFTNIIELGDITVESGRVLTLSDNDVYNTITIKQGGEVIAEGKDILVFKLIIERTFTYDTDKESNEQWFNLGLPFTGIASSSYVQKYNSETGEYESAVCGEDYATASYNSERRATDGYNADGSNWDLQITEGDKLGELIQFAETGTHKYRFISPSTDEAKVALKIGRTGSTYYNSDMESGGKNGWNIVPAGKTYSTKDNYAILNGLVTIQAFDGISKFEPISIDEISTLAPSTVFGVQLYEEFTTSTTSSSSNSEAVVECYSFELVDAEGVTLDRIYLYDGSNHVKYRLGKISAISSDVAQIAIKIDDTSYCTYSTLASETDKSYNVSLTNTNGATLVMKSAGSQTVTVDGATATLDSPITVEDGEIVITIGSTVSGVDSLTESITITGANGTISISGVETGTDYAITSMGGIITYGTTTGETTHISLQTGIYIVKINNTTTKVIVK